MAEKQTTDEKPLALRGRRVPNKKTKDQASYCIIHFHQNKSEQKLRKVSETCFNKIKDTVKLRVKRGQKHEKLTDICSQVPEQYSSSHGVHPWCYKSFTNTSRLLKRTHSDTNDSQEPCTSKKRRISEQTILFPNNRCIFCDKERITHCGKEERLIKCQTKTAEHAIKKAASDKQDQELLTKISGTDLLAREAYYHSFCRKAYTRPKRQHDTSETLTPEQVAHANAFDYLCDHINDSIINGSNVERMSMLRERYLQFMLDKSPQFYNASYKTHKLKAKIMKHFGAQLQFWQPNYRSELVYATDVTKGQAVESAFEAASSDMRRLEEAGLLLRRLIMKAHEESSTMPWPPTAAFLQSNTIQPPILLQEFLTVLITGKRNDPSERSKRHAGSLAQDICHTVTRGQWTMPKHLLLGMSLRHLTGSAEVITMINRFGHCSSYSALLELETAMCKNVVEHPGTIPPTITPINNAVVHLCWDNFDLNEETLSGAGTTHTSHGIIIQEVTKDGSTDVQTSRTEEQMGKKSKDRSVNYVHQEIEPCFLKDKAEPLLALDRLDASDMSAVSKAQLSDLIWLFCRTMMVESTQTVPAWAGWITLTGGSEDKVPNISQVDYMPPILSPITENSTVQHIVKVSQQASREVGQEYTIVCFDLAVAKKAYALVWQQPRAFADVIVRMGGFHITCAFMGALGKYIRCSGFEEILIESGICASGSIEKVMTGKHYNRAIRVHKTVAEALERLLMKKFEEIHAVEEEDKTVFQRLAHKPNKENLSEVLSNDSCTNLLNEYREFRNHVLMGGLGKTAKMWMQYLDFVWMLLRFQRATKENNLSLHLASLEDMCSLFFSYDHPNYARYTVVYILTMLNLDKTHPGAKELLENKGISVNRSNVPSSRNAVDITIEQTINRHAKSQGGIIGFSRNHSAYYRWCATRHSRASYLQATLELAEMDASESSSHKDVRLCEISKSEEATGKVVKAITNFINPFQVDDKDSLYCLSSGAPATKDVEEDLLSVCTVGQEAKSTFIKERLVDKVKSFNAPIKRQKLKTFCSMAKSAKVTGPRKSQQLTAERNVLGQLVLLSLKHDICMKRVLSYPLGPVPWSLATSDGTPVKTDKSQLIHALENDHHHVVKPTHRHITYIIDGCALLQAQVALPTTFGELAESIFDQLPKVDRVDFVTDKYEAVSIKAIERNRRGSTKPHLINGSLTKIPRDWKAFLSCDENKQNFISFLLKEWKQNRFATKLQDREIYFVCGDACYCLSSQDGMETISNEVEELTSTQEEADTRIVLHCFHSAEHSRVNDIIIRSPDTDVFVLALHFAQNIEQQVLFDTGVGNRRRLIDVHMVIAETGEDLCSALPALHAFSGSDSTSAFVRKGKKTVLKTIRRHPEYLQAFLSLGRSTCIDKLTSQRLEEFCCLLYGGSAPYDINALRHEKFLQRYSPNSGTLLSTSSGVDSSLLPPCKDALEMHLMRANYQALVWYNADKANPDLPLPCGHGWEMNNGQLTINWTGGDLLPQELVNVLPENPQTYSGLPGDDGVELQNLDDIIFLED